MTSLRLLPASLHWGLLTLAVVACAAGCAPREGAYVARTHRSYEVPLNNVGLTSRALARSVAVEGQGSGRSPANTLEVWVELRNRADAQQTLSLRTRFYDAARQPLEDTQWTRLFVGARALTSYRALATRADAAYYYVEVKED